MASTRKGTTKDGRVFYEISVSRSRGKSRLTRRWYPPEGWSRKAIERELAAVAAEFERQSDAGEVISRAEHREREAQKAAEAAKILTLRQYGGTGVHAGQDGDYERKQPRKLPGLSG